MTKFLNSLLANICLFFALTAISVLLWVKGIVNGRAFGILYLALIALFTYLVFRVISRRNNPDTISDFSNRESGVLGRQVALLRIAVIAMPMVLIYGLVITKGQPLLPRLVGACVNISLTVWLLSILLRVRAKKRFPK